jgi:hypothetical protein
MRVSGPKANRKGSEKQKSGENEWPSENEIVMLREN